jgi:hypothetical protein
VAHHWDYDVFVSYAHADNGIPEGTSAKFGWVTTLARNLNIGPNAYPKNLFIDHQLKPGDEFSDDLLTKVEGSALLVLLLSQNYIDSKWCGKEGELLYWRMLNELRTALDSRLRARRASSSLAAAATPAATPDVAAPAAPQGKTPPLGTVLLADVTKDLEACRNAVKVALEPEGIAVLPECDCVGLTPNEFESEVDADLKRSTLFVQLLSPAAGRKGKGFAAPLPQLQFARAQAAQPRRSRRPPFGRSWPPVASSPAPAPGRRSASWCCPRRGRSWMCVRSCS